MNTEFIVAADRPVEALLHAILDTVHRCAAEQSVSIFIGGAMARDILLRHVYGLEPGRATRDVDLGVYLESWEQFQDLKNRLLEHGGFRPASHSAQRLLYMPQSDMAPIPLDLIPFGPIANGQEQIAWPPGHDIVMNVAGFAQAHQSAVGVDIGQGLVVRVCSLASLSILKLLAWHDRGQETSKDAQDFMTLCEFYGDAGNEDRIYQGHAAIAQSYAFDMKQSGAHFLGRDARHECSPEHAETITARLGNTEWRQRLSDSLIRSRQLLCDGSQRFDEIIQAYLQGFRSGL